MIYYLLGVLLLLVLVSLAAPVSLGYDSIEKRWRVKWLGLTMARRLRPKKPGATPQKPAKKRKITALAFMERLWQKRALVLEIISRAGRFVLEVCRTLSFRDSEIGVSLPDPMWNGVLYGVLTNLHLPELNLSVNFENRNYAKIWVTVYPHRVAGPLAALLIRLPYLNIIRLAWDLRNQAERG